MNYNHLYYFNTVAKVGNVTQAAKQLYISQPNNFIFPNLV